MIPRRNAPAPTLLPLLALALLPAPLDAQLLPLTWEKPGWWVWCGIDLEVSLVREETTCAEHERTTAFLAETREQLDASSAWLRSLGFAGPWVFPAADVAAADEASLDATTRAVVTGAAGVRAFLRENVAQDYLCREVFYCATLSLLTSAEGAEAGHYASPGFVRLAHDYAADDATKFTPTHELFHAVQEGSEGFLSEEVFEHGWVVEGTAQHVEMVRAGRGYGYDQTHYRFFDDPLHRSDPDGSEADWWDWAYGTWQFWAFLGRQLGSADGVQYLVELFERDLGPADGTDAVDRFLEARGALRLWDAYTEFVRQDLSIERQCHFRDLGLPDFGRCHLIENETARPVLTADAARPFAEAVRTVEVEALATKALVVRTELPEDRAGGLSVWVEEPFDDGIRLVVDRVRVDEGRAPGERPNRFFGVVPPGRDSVLVKVVMAPPGGRYIGSARATVRLRLDVLEPCDLATMLEAMDADWLTGASALTGAAQDVRRRAAGGGGIGGLVGRLGRNLRLGIGGRPSPGFGGGPRVGPGAGAAPGHFALPEAFLEPDAYASRFEPFTEMTPTTGSLRLEGLVRDGGVACAPPVGTNPQLAPVGGGGPEEAFAAVTSGAAGVADSSYVALPTPPHLEELLPDFGPAMERVSGLMGVDGDALLHLFAPNAGTWQSDVLNTSTHHDGLGGWRANAAANVIVRTPGVAPHELQEGETYPAVLFLGALMGETPVYFRWEGVRHPIEGNPDGGGGLPAFLHLALQGRYELLSATELAGTVTVDRLTGGEVRGRFELEGSARLHAVETVLTHDRDGRVNGVRAVDEQDRTGSLRLAGDFRAPAARNVRRPGRLLSVQHRVDTEANRLAAVRRGTGPGPRPDAPPAVLTPAPLPPTVPAAVPVSLRPVRLSLPALVEGGSTLAGPAVDAVASTGAGFTLAAAADLRLAVDPGATAGCTDPLGAPVGSRPAAGWYEGTAWVSASESLGEALVLFGAWSAAGRFWIRLRAPAGSWSSATSPNGARTVTLTDASLDYGDGNGTEVTCPGAGRAQVVLR